MICEQTVEKYCQEYWLIENYDQAMADKTHTWDCHHRHEIDWNLPREELISIGRYYNVHYSELIFLTPNEHRRLHMEGENNPHYGKEGPNKGKPKSAEWKQKVSDALKGKPKSEKQKRKIGEANTKFHISAEELYNLYIVKGLNQYQIADLYGCSQTCIQRQLKKYNIIKKTKTSS